MCVRISVKCEKIQIHAVNTNWEINKKARVSLTLSEGAVCSFLFMLGCIHKNKFKTKFKKFLMIVLEVSLAIECKEGDPTHFDRRSG